MFTMNWYNSNNTYNDYNTYNRLQRGRVVVAVVAVVRCLGGKPRRGGLPCLACWYLENECTG
jgi:hypothetical protein